MELRQDYIERGYEIVNIPKLNCLGKTMKLRDVLDLWWNSVRIDGNICYKNVYKYAPEYELDGLNTDDLERSVKVEDRYILDYDGFPIVFANFVEKN